ncbi:MAG: polysaccharide biosynthesis/export family protein [Vicinamibacterales bacterium]
MVEAFRYSPDLAVVFTRSFHEGHATELKLVTREDTHVPRATGARFARWCAGVVSALFALLVLTPAVSAQVVSPDPGETPAVVRQPAAPRPLAGLGESTLTPTEYRIGADDVLSITVLQAPELNTSVRVAEAGDISLPLIGVVHASALTTRELENAIKTRLREGFIRDPEVTVLVTEIRSRGVSVVGAIQRPGVIQVRGTTTLLEVLSMAGGLSANAGDSVVVVRGNGQTTAQQTIDIKLKALMAADMAANIQLLPGDVVNVQSAALIYVMGSVNKPGAYAMRGNDRLTVLRALAYGEGAAAAAGKSSAFVLRVGDQGERVEIPVNLDDILKGRAPDIEMQAQDVLFVPENGSKKASIATINYLTRIISLRGFLP